MDIQFSMEDVDVDDDAEVGVGCIVRCSIVSLIDSTNLRTEQCCCR